MVIKIKRLYDSHAPGDGFRILVDRLWPRGMAKEKANINYWAKSVAPSNDLRRWYKHERKKWPEFKKRYFAELDANPTGLMDLKRHMSKHNVTFLFSSKETEFNNAVALMEYLKKKSIA